MRLRNIKGSRERIAVDEAVVQEPERQKGSWSTFFGNENSIYIEIGMGKGQFITQMALANPDRNYIGIEKYSSVLIRAIEKRERLMEEGNDLSNLYYIRMDAENLTEVFDRDEVSGIYLNFSDPWPKERHAKRRLTSRQFFARYDQVLVPDGEVVFKTDNRPLFDFSLEEVTVAGWILKDYTYDLHHSPYAQGNIMTEYEEKFSSMGTPINRLRAYREKKQEEQNQKTDI